MIPPEYLKTAILRPSYSSLNEFYNTGNKNSNIFEIHIYVKTELVSIISTILPPPNQYQEIFNEPQCEPYSTA